MHASISRLLFNLPTPCAYAVAAPAWKCARPWVAGGATPSPATGDNSISPSRASDCARTLAPRCLHMVRHAPATPLASAPPWSCHLRRPSPCKPASAASVRALHTVVTPLRLCAIAASADGPGGKCGHDQVMGPQFLMEPGKATFFLTLAPSPHSLSVIFGALPHGAPQWGRVWLPKLQNNSRSWPRSGVRRPLSSGVVRASTAYSINPISTQ
jgi:hypothetical protein